MNLYYAMGGGLGHLTRARAFLRTLDIEKESVILTSSDFAKDKRVIGNLRVIQAAKSFEKDVETFQNFLQKTFSELNIKTIYLDAFPLGIIGELADFDFQNIELNYVARRLKWNNYSTFMTGKAPRFEKTFILEPLETAHQKFVDEFSNGRIDIELNYPVPKLSAPDEKVFQAILKTRKPFWLVVHAGDESEVLELVNYAEEMREIEQAAVTLILISPCRIRHDNLVQYNLYPASVLFDAAQRIFTAGGFNAMNQLKDFRNKHHFIPFERRYDDQFLRAARAKTKS